MHRVDALRGLVTATARVDTISHNNLPVTASLARDAAYRTTPTVCPAAR